MFIVNKQPNLKHIGLPGLEVKTITLHPGVNEVEADLWASVSKGEVVASWVKQGFVEPLREDPKQPMQLTVELVEQTYREDLLKRWLSKHTTGPLAYAVQQQLEKIDPTKPQKE